MAVFKHQSKWRAEVYIQSRRILSKSGFSRKSDAQRWHDEQAVKLRNGELVKQREYTFDELLEAYRTRHLVHVTFNTRERYEVDLKYRIEPYFKFMKLSNVSPAFLEEFKSKIYRELKSPKSVNNCLHLLRAIFNKGVKWEMIEKSPYRLDSLQVPRRNYPWWDKKSWIQSFLREAEDFKYYGVYVVALYTGMRYGEIIGLNRKDVDLANGRINVHRQWLERQRCYGPVKHKIPRYIDFESDSIVGKVLRQHCRIAGIEGALFVTSSGNHPCKSGIAGKYFSAIIRRAKVPRICFHGLRHTFASWYMKEVDDIWALKEILGHSNIVTTQRYAHHSRRQRKQMICFDAGRGVEGHC